MSMGLAPLLCALAATALGWAIEIAHGHIDERAIAWLTLALGLLAACVAAPQCGFAAKWRAPRDGWLGWLLAVLASLQILELATHLPGAFGGNLHPPGLAWFRAGCAGFAVAVWLHLVPSHRLQRLQLPLLLATSALLGVWLIHASPDPHIDVLMIHRESARALLHGSNPYALTFPNIYTSTQMYGPEQLANGRLNFGYCYPPVPLVLTLPGYLLGDVRYAQLLATTATGALLGLMRPGRHGTAAAALLLTTPRFFYVLEHGWTEPFVLLTLAITVYCACRSERVLPWAYGIFLAAKQYCFLTLPLALLLLPTGNNKFRFLLKASCAAALTLVPFFLWDPRAFWWDTVALQFYSPFRPDSLSYLAWLAKHGGKPLPSTVGFLAALPPLALGVWRGARSPSGFAAATACVYLCFFAFNKQAFSNYYFFVVGAICCAIAAAQPTRSESAASSSPS